MKNISLILLLFSFISCSNEPEKILPPSTGGTGQILIITDDSKWDKQVGLTIKEAFSEDYELLPQSEPLFDISQISNNAYSGILQRTRNIFHTLISQKVEKNEVLFAENKHSAPQIIVSVKAKSDEDFLKLFKQYKNQIIKTFTDAERNRLIKGYSGKLLNKSLKEKLEKQHHISLSFPKGYTLDVDSSNFAWVSRETPFSTEAVLIWSYPYTDTAQFHPDSLIKVRNSVTKKFVPGPEKDTYMTTEDLITPIYREFMLNDKYTAELRGLWKIGGAEGTFMGGPFVSFSTVDTKRNKIITVDGFVYGGKKKKRELLKQIEAILYTLKLTD
jgi:hypothetical protein